ncbi:MAG: DUF4430 domain-containing protein [Clostridia bacterium]|nr:DUF4430 domain-containing protein [Clostridia bacterium]
MKRQTLAWLLALVLLAASIVPASAANARMQQVETLLKSLVQSELSRSGAADVQAWVDGPLAATAGQGAEWTVLALAQLKSSGLLPDTDLTPYRIALEAFLSQDAAYGASTRQKYALCMLAAGGNVSVADVAETTIGQQGIMSWIYGLHLLSNGCINSQLTAADAAEQLVSMQLPDGGWALMGQAADVDVTAMVLQALAPHQKEPSIAASVEAAVSLLAARQQPDGGFVSMGQPNPESAAQVMIALCALGIDPLEDKRFQQHGATPLDSITAYQLPEGGYAHAMDSGYSAATTVQVLDALAAYVRFAKGLPGLYLLDGANGQVAGKQAENAAATGDTASTATAAATTNTLTTPDTAANTTASYPILDTSAASIGIIGGADGPTAVFITGQNRWKPMAITVILVLAALWCLTLLIRRKKKLKSYLSVALVVAALLGGVLALDIQLPEHYYGASPGKGNIVGSVTLDIRCDALAKEYTGEYIPADGIILPKTVFFLQEGDTVYDLLTRAVRQHQLHLDASGGDGMQYVNGLNHLYEQAYGALSGWMYLVNGESASQGCDQYRLADGDHVSWQYTLEMGQDLE